MNQVMLLGSESHFATSAVGVSGAISLTQEECEALMNIKKNK